MEQSNQHEMIIRIAGAEPFRLPVAEDEESFYRYIIERINENLQSSASARTPILRTLHWLK